MKLALLLLALGGVAHAGSVKPPAGWTSHESAAASLAQQLGAVPHFAGLQSIVSTEVYRPPTGGSLYVTRVVANAKPVERDHAASVELGEIRASFRRAGDAARPESAGNRFDDATKQLEGYRRWTDASTKVTTSTRMVIAADAQQLVAVMGECVLGEDASVDVITTCRHALDSLDAGIALAARVPMTIDLKALDAAERPPAAPTAGSSSGPSLVESGERPSLPPMQIPQDPREPDRRPIFVGFGLIVLALVFYWNRKNREKLERQYEKETADKPAAEPESKPAKSDRDADDLHAAAEDDTKESKS